MWTYIPFLTRINNERNFCPTCRKGVFRHSRGRYLKQLFARSARVVKSFLHV